MRLECDRNPYLQYVAGDAKPRSMLAAASSGQQIFKHPILYYKCMCSSAELRGTFLFFSPVKHRWVFRSRGQRAFGE